MLISLSGVAGSGKSTVAGILVDCFGFIEISFAKVLKKHIGEGVFDLSHEQLYGSLKEVVDLRYRKSPREILQLGGEYMRKIHPDIWIERALGGIAPEELNYVVSDARYFNELLKTDELGGETWLIRRPGAGAKNGVLNHVSETEFASWVFDRVIFNTGSLEDLKGIVKDKITGGFTCGD